VKKEKEKEKEGCILAYSVQRRAYRNSWEGIVGQSAGLPVLQSTGQGKIQNEKKGASCKYSNK